MLKLSLLMVMIFQFSLNAQAAEPFENCEGYGVEALHAKAVGMMLAAQEHLKKKPQSPVVTIALDKYFKLNGQKPSQIKEIQIVLQNMQKIALKASQTSYVCSPNSSHLWCLNNPYGIVPLPKSKVYLCSAFFERLNEKQKLGTLIHEWFHLWGESRINYFSEQYCKQSFSLPSSELIKNADQYMLFSYFVGGDRYPLECF